MCSDPSEKNGGLHLAAGQSLEHIHHNVVVAGQKKPVQLEERFERREAGAFVPIEERMVHRDEEPERRRPVSQRWIGVFTERGLLWRRDRVRQSMVRTDAGGAAMFTQYAIVQLDDLIDGQVPHYFASLASARRRRVSTRSAVRLNSSGEA